MKKTLFIPLLLLTSCASMFDGSKQNIAVEIINIEDNKPLAGANCTVTDKMGMVYKVPENPGVFEAKKGQGALLFDCRKSGFAQKNVMVRQHFNGTTILNTLIPPGYLIDAATGAMFEYPTNVVIKMQGVSKE